MSWLVLEDAWIRIPSQVKDTGIDKIRTIYHIPYDYDIVVPSLYNIFSLPSRCQTFFPQSLRVGIHFTLCGPLVSNMASRHQSFIVGAEFNLAPIVLDNLNEGSRSFLSWVFISLHYF